MTGPLMALAVGAIVAGFVGLPQALGGGNAIEHFLAPSFAAPAADAGHVAEAAAAAEHGAADAAAGEGHGLELWLMVFSVLIAAVGILVARHLYVTSPDIPVRIAARWPGAYALLFNKYYVDELYDATAIRGTKASARGLWGFDRVVVDGAVDGSGLVTRLAAWFSHLADKYVVDGAVNLAGWTAGEGSVFLRRLQTGLVQNYALLMLVGVFVFLTLYLIAR
jgi:NADH-quinone oxidoreductase subunit L